MSVFLCVIRKKRLYTRDVLEQKSEVYTRCRALNHFKKKTEQKKKKKEKKKKEQGMMAQCMA